MKFIDALEWMRARPGRELGAKIRGCDKRLRFNEHGELEESINGRAWEYGVGICHHEIDADWLPVGEEDPKPAPQCRIAVMNEPSPGWKTSWPIPPKEDPKKCEHEWGNADPFSAGKWTCQKCGKVWNLYERAEPEAHKSAYPATTWTITPSALSAGDKPVAVGFGKQEKMEPNWPAVLSCVSCGSSDLKRERSCKPMNPSIDQLAYGCACGWACVFTLRRDGAFDRDEFRIPTVKPKKTHPAPEVLRSVGLHEEAARLEGNGKKTKADLVRDYWRDGLGLGANRHDRAGDGGVENRKIR